MNARRAVVGIVTVLLASQYSPLASAQIVEQAAEMSETAPADAATGTSQVIPFFNRIARAWSLDDSVGELSPPAVPQDAPGRVLPRGPETEAFEECCEPSCQSACPCIYGQVEALFLWRHSRLIDQPIIVDANTGETFMSSSDLDSGFSTGVRTTFGTRVCGGWMLEYSYFGLFQGNSTARAVSPGAGAFLIFPDNFFGNVFVGIDLAQANYSTALNNFELNLPCCCECGDQCCDECACDQVRQSYEWFSGIRYINVDENLNILAQRTVADATETGSYDISTDNDLYGLQLGARTRRMRGRFGWEASGKLGLFVNNARQQQTVTDFPDFELRDVSSSSTNLAYLGEFNLSALYQLTPVWNLRAGYTALWIDGLALAPDQLDFDFASATGGEQLHNGGAIFLHGLNAGIEARW